MRPQLARARGVPLSASKPLTPPADARFDGSVRLVYRRKNVIGIVLTEAGKVYQQAMLIGHGEGDL